MAHTVSAYRIRLDDMSCDEDGCEDQAEIAIFYRSNEGESFHQFWCAVHEKTLSPGSKVFEVIEPWPPVDADDEVLVDDLVRRRMEHKKTKGEN